MKVAVFKGQRKDNGEWVCGSYCYLAGLAYIAEYAGGLGENAEGKIIGGWLEVLPSTVECVECKDHQTKWRAKNGTIKKKETQIQKSEDESVQKPCQSSKAVDVQSQGKTKVD